MLPADYILLDQLPEMTTQGKIDRQQLLKLKSVPTETRNQIEPSSDIEKKLAVIWVRH